MPQPDDSADRTPPKGNKKVLLIVGGIAAALFLLCGGVIVGGYFWMRPSAEERAKAEAHKAKLWDKNELNKAVLGKNE